MDCQVYDVPDNGFGFFQLLFLGAVYAYILFTAANLISSGSELLMLIPSLKGIVGPVVLPVLGAVPDGAIVIFSGLGPIASAQEQLSVGIGALAGSTIMLLTIPWGLSIYYGRVRIDDEGKGTYTKKHARREVYKDFQTQNNLSQKDEKDLSPSEIQKLELFVKDAFKHGSHKLPEHDFGSHITHTGVTAGTSISKIGYIMLLTAVAYIIIEVGAMMHHCTWTSGNTACGKRDAAGDLIGSGKDEKLFAWIGLIYSTICFVGYIIYGAMTPANEDVEAKRIQKLIEKENLTVQVAFGFILNEHAKEKRNDNDKAALKAETLSGPERKLAEKVLLPLFKQFDTGNDGALNAHELKNLMNNTFKSSLSHDDATDILNTMEGGGTINGKLDKKEFIDGFFCYFRDHQDKANGHNAKPLEKDSETGMAMTTTTGKTNTDYQATENDDDEEEEGEEEEEIPDWLDTNLSEADQHAALIKRSLLTMGAGTVICLLFSDAMVNILSELGTRTGIPAFFVSFTLAPLASNASELIASLSYAAKKTKCGADVSFGQLLGAAIMNNTFCLGIFLALICFRPLVWTFTAETFVILFIELVMIYMALKTTHRLSDALLVLSLYPLSIIIVWILEYPVGLN